jgi:hypothetical protein
MQKTYQESNNVYYTKFKYLKMAPHPTPLLLWGGEGEKTNSTTTRLAT